MMTRAGTRSDALPANGSASTTRGRLRRATPSRRSGSRSWRGQLEQVVVGRIDRVAVTDRGAIIWLGQHKRVPALRDERREILTIVGNECSAAVLPRVVGNNHQIADPVPRQER